MSNIMLLLELPNDILYNRILSLAPQLATTCKNLYKLLPKNNKYYFPIIYNNQTSKTNQKNDLWIYKEVIVENNFAEEYKIKFIFLQKELNFDYLNELIIHPNTQRLSLHCNHPIFIEMKKFFSILISENNISFTHWKYYHTFINVFNQHKNQQQIFVNFSWLDSIITSFLFYLYH